jgi:hypothetical protein
MKIVNYFTTSARQLDKFKLEFRLLGFTIIELKFDISNRCFKFVLLNMGIATKNCVC